MNKTRKSAPDMVVVDPFRDDRAATLAQLSNENPDYVFAFQRGDVKTDELKRKGQEVVKDESGETVKHESDVVVRIPKELFKKQRERESLMSYQSSKKMVQDDGSLRQFAKPKNVKVKQDDGE